MKKLLTAMSIGMIFFQSCTKENSVTPKGTSTNQIQDETSLPNIIKTNPRTVSVTVVKDLISSEAQDARKTPGKVSEQTPPIYVPGVISND